MHDSIAEQTNFESIRILIIDEGDLFFTKQTTPKWQNL
jgi:hypothetical protein